MTTETIVIAAITGTFGLIISIIGYLLKRQIEEISENMKKQNEINATGRERLVKLETNQENREATLHEFSTIIENIQETIHSIAIQLGELKSDIKNLRKEKH